MSQQLREHYFDKRQMSFMWYRYSLVCWKHIRENKCFQHHLFKLEQRNEKIVRFTNQSKVMYKKGYKDTEKRLDIDILDLGISNPFFIIEPYRRSGNICYVKIKTSYFWGGGMQWWHQNLQTATISIGGHENKVSSCLWCLFQCFCNCM